MSDSTTHMTHVQISQAGKEAVCNELFNACGHYCTFGRRESSAALNFDYFGGRLLVDGVSTAIANATLALTASATNYIETTRAGVVSKNTTAFTAGQIPLYKVLTNTAGVTSYEDRRPWVN